MSIGLGFFFGPRGFLYQGLKMALGIFRVQSLIPFSEVTPGFWGVFLTQRATINGSGSCHPFVPYPSDHPA